MPAVPHDGFTTQLVVVSPDGKSHTLAAQLIDSPGAPAAAAAGLTDAQLRASPVATADAAATAKIEELRLQLVTLLGNTDNVETLQTNAINLLTLTNQYNDGIEGLLTTLGSNTDGLETLISTMTGHVDALEPLLTEIKALATTDAAKQDAQKAVLDAMAHFSQVF